MMRFIWLGFLITLTVWSGSSPAANCRLGADYYQRAKSESNPSRRIHWLNQSVRVCPNFNAWYMLGLLYSRQEQPDRAMEAWIQARSAAGSGQTEALALARQAELLSANRQWLRALQALELAKRYHPAPAPAWLEEALKAARIRAYHAGISAGEIVRIFEIGTQTSMDGRFAVRPAVNLPVHFEFDRALLNPAGSRQVIELGRALERFQIKPWSFLLVGHTDKRGSMAYNQTLSENRAQTVKMKLEQQFPSLAGKLETRGRGESELLYPGDTEAEHMLNRRVRVTVVGDE
jgi:outer membrane protein OmpA-like peptidoglycan-associated protein